MKRTVITEENKIDLWYLLFMIVNPSVNENWKKIFIYNIKGMKINVGGTYIIVNIASLTDN